MSGFIARDCGVVAFVIAFVRIGDMAGGATHTAEVASHMSALDSQMATLAFSTNVCEGSQLGVVSDLVGVWCWRYGGHAVFKYLGFGMR